MGIIILRFMLEHGNSSAPRAALNGFFLANLNFYKKNDFLPMIICPAKLE